MKRGAFPKRGLVAVGSGLRGRALAVIPMLAMSGWLVFQQPGFLIAAFLLPALLAVSIDRGARRPTAASDPLTGLDLRDGLVEAIGYQLQATCRSNLDTAVLIFEIDGYKSLQERLDRPALDRLMQDAALRLVSCVRDADTCARLDGPTFALCVAAMNRIDPDDAEQLARRVQSAMGGATTEGEPPIRLTVSVGYARDAALDAPSAEHMIQSATLALIEAQRCGPASVRGFDAEIQDRIARRDRLARSLGAALETGEIVPWFQPQVCATTGAVAGVEALARWQTPDGGLVAPGEFLPVLEECGLMKPFGASILSAALQALADWDADGLHLGRVGVNFSAAELSEPGLVDRVSFTLGRFGLDPGRLCVEVLETVVAGGADNSTVSNLEGLARLGCVLDLDDFGTGHASITSIRRMPIHRLKIDRSFVTGIDRDPEQQRMVSAILTMAERLGLETLAEGVETPAERQRLEELGCRHLQGYAIARPMPRSEVEHWIRTHGPAGTLPGAAPARDAG